MSSIRVDHEVPDRAGSDRAGHARLDRAGSDRIDHAELSGAVHPVPIQAVDARLTGVEYPDANQIDPARLNPTDPPGDLIPADDGCRLWTTVIGGGEPLILCHGGPGLWDMFGDLAAVLATRLRVIRWDQRGCGRSERRGPYSLAQTIADLDAVRRYFGLARATVLGHSWGATLALRYALDHPAHVAKLVYVSGTGLGRAWHPSYEHNLAGRLGPDLSRLRDLNSRARTPAEDRELAVLQWSADFPDPSTALTHAERMATPWFPINYECNAAINTEEKHHFPTESELIAACRALPTPTLIVDGDQDIRPRWAVDSLHAALPTATRVTLPGVGHVPWLESPGAVATALLDFLAPQA
ncbi:alpha/beta hydrolase [Amycolatopsis sp. NPDC051372]|uniref:alpha/beta fold hydrolase n=1 Tax=Amycolatopsis sp. NPDC051372 TaxID=3155669 RepID=UPI003418A44E